MGEDGIKLLQQRLAERTREHKATREAALESQFRKLPAPMPSKNDKLVHNLSSKELTEEQMPVLRHGASLNTADAKPANMIAAVESILSQTGATDKTKNLIRHQVSSLLMAHRPRDVLPKVERDALKELRADNDLVIVPADKGRSMVVLDRTDYNQKAKSLLEDRQSYVAMRSLEEEIYWPDVSDSHSNPSSETFADRGEGGTRSAVLIARGCRGPYAHSQPRAINTALLVPPSPLSVNVSDCGFESESETSGQ
nr:unnamed protein product [Spirometra erinaceieuropaei]